jgi:hypothetical protein
MNRDLVKRSLIGVVAAVCLISALWVLLVSVRNVLVGSMHLHGAKQSVIYFYGLAMFLWLIWLSLRGLRIALGIVPLSEPRLKMWRLFVGVLLLLSSARSMIDPAANRYQADNFAQAIGMYCGFVILSGFAIWIIRSAFPRAQRTGPRPL